MSALEVLVVEDALEYSHVITAVLRQGGHRVHVAASLREAEAALLISQPDLVLLDLTLPDGDGLELCRIVREKSNAYIMVLSARDDEVDKLTGFRLGADDYVTKPISPRLLAARVQAMARRPRQADWEQNDKAFGNITIRRNLRKVEVDGRAVGVTRTEFDLLATLVSNPNTVFSRSQLVHRVWGAEWRGHDHVIDVHIANLRRKLQTAGANEDLVRTVRGVGYGFGGIPAPTRASGAA